MFTWPPGGVRSIAMRVSVSVCLSVCLLAYIKNHMSILHEIFSTCYPWPWLDPLTKVQYVKYFRFCV